jgi:hypothetical protein
LVDILSADPAVSRSGVHLNWGASAFVDGSQETRAFFKGPPMRTEGRQRLGNTTPRHQKRRDAIALERVR